MPDEAKHMSQRLFLIGPVADLTIHCLVHFVRGEEQYQSNSSVDLAMLMANLPDTWRSTL